MARPGTPVTDRRRAGRVRASTSAAGAGMTRLYGCALVAGLLAGCGSGGEQSRATGVPATAETVRVRGGTVTVDGDDHVTVYGDDGRKVGESWCGGNGFDYRRSVELLSDLQDALRSGDREGLADLVLFPLRWNHDGTSRFVATRASIDRLFARIFTPEVVADALDSDARALFCRSEGFMLGSGVVWGRTDGRDRYGITTVNG